MADLFLQRNMVREATAFLLEVLNDNDPKNGVLQTKLLEINLVTNPQAGATGGGGGGGGQREGSGHTSLQVAALGRFCQLQAPPCGLCAALPTA